ncbi:hypothetical protein [Parabacteroides sp. PF5-6]|uniref:hypothetical protein n=1 Tax=Parabacteroides sp. PF5-6 TaxID=1742403 RepID=UPI0024056F96|nr:hypothetical protein [Parabacteroides sp. PF5-6]MDF9830032.1 hypothetical protein [Parabacteroides sp. PF5-6]
MTPEIIYAPEKTKYLGDFMSKLPTKCLLDKGRTGCGGTELAIRCEKDMIIVMPFVSLIKNKLFQHNETETKILGVYSSFGLSKDDIQPATDEEIVEYVKTQSKRKLLVTYDSLSRLVKLLLDNDIEVFHTFGILVDEWHLLFNQYVFRNCAIKRVLNTVSDFEEYTYMTATPIEEEFLLEEMKDIPVKQVKWENTKEVTVYSKPTNSPTKTVCYLIVNALNGKILGNLHIFVNSVDFIAKVIKDTGIRPEHVRVICSKNNNPGKGKKKNQTKLGNDYPIAETTDPVKKINFYTSTCFEGCDIYDPEGKTYIVSDKNKSHTLMDISTLFIQICGRIRDSEYNTHVTHIYSETRYSGNVTLEEFTQSSYKVLAESESLVEEVNAMSETNRKKVIKSLLKEMDIKYLSVIDDKLVIDKNLIKVDIMNFKITKHLYQLRLRVETAYSQSGFKVKSLSPHIFETDKIAANPKAKVSFMDLFLEYATIRDSLAGLIYFPNGEDRLSIIEKTKPMLKEAYELLGVDRVKCLKYHVGNIRRELTRLSDTSMDNKIVKCLKEEGIGEVMDVPSSKIKKTLQGIYNSLGKRLTAKATDIENWFDAEKFTLKIDGKSTECYHIKRRKLI